MTSGPKKEGDATSAVTNSRPKQQERDKQMKLRSETAGTIDNGRGFIGSSLFGFDCNTNLIDDCKIQSDERRDKKE